MPISWDKKIRDSGKLSVFDEISVGAWATIFRLALESFNKNLKRIWIELVPALFGGEILGQPLARFVGDRRDVIT